MESEKKTSKIVVFDLDETLGYFTELGILWDALLSCKNNPELNIYIRDDFAMTPELFNEILDLYPEFLRPNITSILNYLKYKKQLGICSGVMIYTNNKGPSEWSRYIINYFQKKINYNLFDQIVGAFKKNGKIIEINRTTGKKTIEDFIKCTKIDSDSEICYIDDNVHKKMVVENVYYIKMISYKYFISYEEVLERFSNSQTFNKIFVNEKNANLSILIKSKTLDYMNNLNYVFINENNDFDKEKDEREITKKTMLLLQTFFDKDWRTKPVNSTFIIKLNRSMNHNISHKTNTQTSDKKIKEKTMKNKSGE